MIMYRFLPLALTLLAALLLSGCSPAQKIVGKWELDIEKTMAEVAGEGPMASMMAMAASQAKLEIEFRGDGNWSMHASTPGKSTQTEGSWRFVKAEDDTLVLMLKLNNESKENEMRVKVIDDNSIEFAPTTTALMGAKALPFRRVTKT